MTNTQIKIRCPECGHLCEESDSYCESCGFPMNSRNSDTPVATETSTNSQQTQTRSSRSSDGSWMNHLNDYVGNDRQAKLNWKILFTDVPKKHTTEDAEEIFIVGTRKTTPSVDEVSKDWPHPWLYSRVFLMFALAFALLWVCCNMFQNSITLPGLIVVGSFAVPLTTLILFFELNAWRNISLYEVIKTFLVGGCASLVTTSLLFSFFGDLKLDFIGAFLIGIIEEAGKAVIVYYFLRKMGKLSILSGLLIGAAVGAGFSAFESSGYAMHYLSQVGWDEMMSVIFLRGFLSPGDHVVWAAISGAGLVIASRAHNEISTRLLIDAKFLRLFIIPVVLHGIWDSPLSNIGAEIYMVPIGLTVFAWIVVLILINMGLAEVSKTQAM